MQRCLQSKSEPLISSKGQLQSWPPQDAFGEGVQLDGTLIIEEVDTLGGGVESACRQLHQLTFTPPIDLLDRSIGGLLGLHRDFFPPTHQSP